MAISRRRSSSESRTAGRRRNSSTSPRTYSIATRSQVPYRPRSTRKRSLPRWSRPLMSVLASTNSFTIPLLPGVLLDLVQEFLHPRPGQPGLLDLLADCFEELVVFAQSPNYRRPANQRHFDIVRSPQAQGFPNLLGQGQLPRSRYLADVRFHVRKIRIP